MDPLLREFINRMVLHGISKELVEELEGEAETMGMEPMFRAEVTFTLPYWRVRKLFREAKERTNAEELDDVSASVIEEVVEAFSIQNRGLEERIEVERSTAEGQL